MNHKPTHPPPSPAPPLKTSSTKSSSASAKTRTAKAFSKLRTGSQVHAISYRGYTEDPEALLKGALFSVTYDEMVIVKDIEMFSLCEHHMLPFFGKVHVAYIPNGKVIGLSKVPRLIEVFSRRLQIQERLTTQIAETIQKVIEPQGVGVVIEARHLCMMMRGVEKQHSEAVTPPCSAASATRTRRARNSSPSSASAPTAFSRAEKIRAETKIPAAVSQQQRGIFLPDYWLTSNSVP